MFFHKSYDTITNMNRSIPCPHGRQRNYCKDCGGATICIHQRQRPSCRDCKGSRFCQHLRTYRTCKTCGTHRLLLRAGFTVAEIQEMGSQPHCQFPGCHIQPSKYTLNSDHAHTDRDITPENYRGEICLGCNVRLKSLDDHPEWATPQELEYMNARPYSRLKSHFS